MKDPGIVVLDERAFALMLHTLGWSPVNMPIAGPLAEPMFTNETWEYEYAYAPAADWLPPGSCVIVHPDGRQEVCVPAEPEHEYNSDTDECEACAAMAADVCPRCHAGDGAHEHWCLCLSEVGDVIDDPHGVKRAAEYMAGVINSQLDNLRLMSVPRVTVFDVVVHPVQRITRDAFTEPDVCDGCNGVGCSRCTDNDGLPL